VLQYLRVPSGPGIRWDSGVEAGNDVTLFYDPLLAKLIAWGETREVAVQRMRRALSELVIVGLPTSQPFHLRVLDDAEFLKGEIDITYLERAGARLLAAPVRAGVARALAVAAALVADERRAAGRPDGPTVAASQQLGPSGRAAVGPSPWVIEGRRLGLRDGLE
jgi:acetyl-CoA carboxylase biotin carboxylase subunit